MTIRSPMPLMPRRPLASERSPWLRGTLNVPGDAVLTHLAMLSAAVSYGETVITGGLRSAGTEATIRALGALGVHAWPDDEGGLHVLGLGMGGLLEPTGPLEFGENAVAVTLMMGLVGTYDFPATFRADPAVSAQSHGALFAALRDFGTTIDSAERGHLPATLHGPEMAIPVQCVLPASAGLTKAALLLAALDARGTSVLDEPIPGPTHAERMLRRFGARLETTDLEGGGRRIMVGGFPELRAQSVAVPADPSLAALGAAAAAIVPGSEVTIPNVLLNPARTAILSALMAMGAGIAVRNLRHDGEEEVADLTVGHEPLRALALAAHHVAPLLEDLPVLAVTAAFSEGVSVFYLPPSLPLLDFDRLRTLRNVLAANGVESEITEEAFAVAGRPDVVGGARLDLDDPGIALAALILGMGARERVTLGDASVIEERYPGFVEAFEEIGAGVVDEGGGQP